MSTDQIMEHCRILEKKVKDQRIDLSRLKSMLEEWIETVQRVDGGVYGCTIDKTREVLNKLS